MTDRVDVSVNQAQREVAEFIMTPAKLQENIVLQQRRSRVLALTLATYCLLMTLAAAVCSAGGWTVVGWVMFLSYAVTVPWVVLGFWNGVIGLWLRHGGGNFNAEVTPFLKAGDNPVCPLPRTAILMTLRNEDPDRALLRLKTVKTSVDATGHGGAFGYFILSDTTKHDAIAAEEAAFAAWKRNEPVGAAIDYRRRGVNTGYKAGNVRDFCEAEGRDFELMIPLDADSLMTGPAIIQLVAIMQAYPKLGILQSLAVGMPTSSAFARLFQFGMRHAMRSYTAGQAWWTADCGPYWGHNGVVRIAPFRDHCKLPVIEGGPPFGGHVLSHDQVEATLMRRAGYEVRVLPVEGGSFEDNPTTLPEFLKRDRRWCQGNLQYVRLLDRLDILPMSRFQLIWAILMFAGQPAMTAVLALLPLAVLHFRSVEAFPTGLAEGLYVTTLLMQLTPKFAGLIDAVLTPGEVDRFGGGTRFVLSASLEIVFSFILSAIASFNTSLFMVGLLVSGRSVVWAEQERDASGVTWRDAARQFWPQTFFGLIICAMLAMTAPAVLIWTLPLTAGYLLAVPFCVATSAPKLGAWLKRKSLARIPEDFTPPKEVTIVQSGA